MIDINDYEISYYDYEHHNRDDDFLGIVHQMLKHDTIIFASPVYWYTMSAQMKTFFDRMSDLLTIEKDLGRQFRDKNMAVICCNSDEDFSRAFELPFASTADYMGMNYLGCLYGWINENGEISEQVLKNITAFEQKLS